MTQHEWLKPGADAVILQPYSRHVLMAKGVKVDRVLKRDVVLADGERFRVDRLEKQVGGTWGPTYYLVSASDPRVEGVRKEIRRLRARGSARDAYHLWQRGEGSPLDVIAAFQALADIEEQS